PGLNYEHLEGAVDDKVRSVRIDQQYRAIVIHPPRGDVYLCVWVDNHDEAYQWVQNKHFEVNKLTGGFQVWEAKTGPGASAPVPRAPDDFDPGPIPRNRLLSGRTNDDLLTVGVPPALIPSVRAMRNEDDLYDMADFLPEDAFDLLHLLSLDYTLTQALEEHGRDTREVEDVVTVDVDDF